ncbi:hypothetical protein TNCV_4928681 [Trichonephila clavipes]|nr:hypothetical protein TNCV_4928681 [Trichonephila clavipes]
MATHATTRRNPAISHPNQANQIVTQTPIITNANVEDNSPQALILKTLQQTIQALTVLTQQVSTLSFSKPAPQPKKTKTDELLVCLHEFGLRILIPLKPASLATPLSPSASTNQDARIQSRPLNVKRPIHSVWDGGTPRVPLPNDAQRLGEAMRIFWKVMKI